MLAFQLKLTLCGGGALPVPVKDSAVGEFAALLMNERTADAVPLLCGVNPIVNEALWPAEIVTGKESPLKANSELVLVPDDTVTLVPDALSVPVWLFVVPTETIPKFNVVGETDKDPAGVPLPESGMVIVEGVAFETTEMLPLALPALVGVKIVLNVTLWPAVSVKGAFKPCSLKPVPVVLACEMVTLELPELVSVSDRVALLPT